MVRDPVLQIRIEQDPESRERMAADWGSMYGNEMCCGIGELGSAVQRSWVSVHAIGK